MKKLNSQALTLKELGLRRISSFNEQPLDITQLHPNFKLPRKWEKKVNNEIKTSAPFLSFLIKTHEDVELEKLWHEIRKYFGSSEKDTKSQQSAMVKKKIKLRKVVKLAHAKSFWWLLEFPVSLGSFLSETKFDLKGLQVLAKQLQAIEYVEIAEANVPYPNQVFPQQEFLPGCTVGRANAPQDNFWSQKLVKLMDNNENRLIQEDGSGIILGHIDTGYTDHSELNINSTYDLNTSTSVIDNSNGLDPMTSGTSHGTATGSLITSVHLTGDASDKVAGIAPGISIVDVRALDFVIVLPVGSNDPQLGALVSTFLPSNVLDAISVCMNAGCNVISMSFGGVVSPAVREIIREAYLNDIIMCAAAGNCVQVVIEPAALSEVIACAAVGINSSGIPHLWTGTSHGPQVDISAPGENVYIADWDNGNQVIRPGEGTSFAAPHIAAAAAVWLEKHGVNALKNEYNGTSYLGDVFRKVVRESATVPNGWDTNQYGAGILNLVDLLKHPRPKKAEPKGSSLGGCTDALAIIDLFLSGNKIPVLSDTVNVRVDLHKIEVRDDGEFWGGSEPYLIETFYRIDGRNAKATLDIDASTLETDGVLNCTFSILRKERDTSIIKIRQRGRHGNLPEVNIGAIEYNSSGPVVINPDNKVARWDTSVRPIPLRILLNTGNFIVGKDVVGIPGFIGALTMLMEEDGWSDDLVDIVKDALVTHTKSTMESILKELHFSLSLSGLNLTLPLIDTEEISLQIEDLVRQSVTANASWWDAIGAAIDGDDILIQDFTIVNVLQLGNPISIAPPEAVNDNGRWLLRGTIKKR